MGLSVCCLGLQKFINFETVFSQFFGQLNQRFLANEEYLQASGNGSKRSRLTTPKIHIY